MSTRRRRGGRNTEEQKNCTNGNKELESGDYTPLWTSQVHKQTAFPQFKEQVDLKIEMKSDTGAVEQWEKTKKAAIMRLQEKVVLEETYLPKKR